MHDLMWSYLELKKERIHGLAILCSGLDDIMRGYETHSRLLFDMLSNEMKNKNDIFLYKRSGKNFKNEKSLDSPSRYSFFIRILKNFRGDAVYWEYIFFAAKFIFHCIIDQKKYKKLLVIEPMVGKVLLKFKLLLPGSPIIIFTHGVWIDPEEYFSMGDIFHQPNIENYNKQKKYFDTHLISKKSYLIPHFIPEKEFPRYSVEEKYRLQRRYNIETEFVLLSVGVINRPHKNMEYLIDETLKLPKDWTLLLCGAIHEPDLIVKGRELLGDRFVHLSVDRNEIEEIYQLADVFVLASKQEGFGIVILEAMRAGLPIILHDREIFHWISNDKKSCVKMDVEGALSQYISYKQNNDPNWLILEGQNNKNLFKSKFSWTALKEQYIDMLFD